MMQKLWAYLAIFLLGYSAGMVSFYYIVRDRIMNRKIVIGKNKQKDGTGNVQDLDIEMGTGEETVKTKAEIRKEKREQRKILKQIKPTS